MEVSWESADDNLSLLSCSIHFPPDLEERNPKIKSLFFFWKNHWVLLEKQMKTQRSESLVV